MSSTTGPTGHMLGPASNTTGPTTTGTAGNVDTMKHREVSREGAQEFPPAGPHTGRASKTVYQTPGEFTPEIQHLTNCLRTLYQARTMEDHNRALNFMDMDVQWDNPFALLRGRDKLRTYLYFVKAFFKFDFAPKVVNVRMLNERRAEVEIDAITRIFPIKNVYTLAFAPFLWLLPEHFDINQNLTLGIKAETDRVSLLKVRIQNWPALPNLVRYALSFVFGQMAVWTEGVWSRTLSWFGDDSYESDRPAYATGTGGYGYTSGTRGSDIFESAKYTSQSMAEQARQMGTNVMQQVEGVGQRVKETVGSLTGARGGSDPAQQGTTGTTTAGYGSSGAPY